MNMIIGVDYASVDGDAQPAWSIAKNIGLSFVIMRAAYGYGSQVLQDPIIKRDLRSAREAALVCGTYLFLTYGKNAPSPEEQAHALAANVGVLPRTDFPPALDIEFPNGVMATGFTVNQAIDWTRRAWSALKDLYGVAPLIYTSSRVWSEDLGNAKIEEFEDSIAWLAKPWPWAVRTPAQIGPQAQVALTSGKCDPTVPPVWALRQWWIHQYQGDAVRFPGFTSTVDVNRFNPMSLGETGPRVAWVQKRLGQVVTSAFDEAFKAKLVAFQSANGLIADGIIGPRTLARIAWCDGVEQPPQPLIDAR